MKTLDEILAPFEGMTYDQLQPLASAIGLPHDTLYKIVKSYTRRPSFEHVRRIAEWADAQENPRSKRASCVKS